MKQIAFPLALLVAGATQAEEGGEIGQGLDLFSQGTQLLLEGLMNELEPALRDLEPALQDLLPMMRELRGMLPDLDLYHLPEMQPNGDIIIRRKDPLPEVGENGEIEL